MTVIMYLFDWSCEAWIVSFDVLFCMFGWVVYELESFSIQEIADHCVHFLVGRFYSNPAPFWGFDIFWISGYHQPWYFENDYDLPF